MGNKKAKRLDLHEALLRKSYKQGVICTFRFDPIFFEEYCLAKFNSLNNNGNLSILVDSCTYEKVILAPESDRPKHANLRYLLHPISVPGVFHPKLFLFVSNNTGRLILGSANFTRPGITSNAELVGCYDYEAEKDESFKPLFHAVFDFLIEISKRWPSEALTSNLQEISREALWLISENGMPSENNIELVHNLDIPLWDQIISGIQSPVDNIYILSRYFDTSPNMLDRLQEDLQPNKIKIFTQNGITTLTEDWLKHPLVKNGNVEILLCTYKDEERSQPLHAKAIAIAKDDKYMFAFGSANFTSSAMFNIGEKGNVEILLILRELTRKEIEPERLFDPDRTAFHLKDEAILQSSKDEEEDFPRSRHEITLFEATLVEDKIYIRADIPNNISYDNLTAKLTFHNETYKSLVLSHTQENKYSASASEDVVHRLGKYSSIIKVEAIKRNERIATSNCMLVTNLQDIETGQSVRRQRHIKEAQQSTIQFFKVLSDLIGEGDDETLRIFLTYCDIPVIDAPTPKIARPIKPIWNGGKGMRNLRERNLKIFVELHELVIDFFDRHFRKLERHVTYGGLNGIANFLHIFLAMAGVLHAEVERAIQGFESKTDPMSPNEWFTYREHLDAYLTKFEQLMRYLWEKYLHRMLKEYELNDIRERFTPNFSILRELCSYMLHSRERIESLRSSKLKVMTEYRKILIPRYFSCIFSEDQWPKFAKEIKTMLDNIESAITG